MVDESRPTDTSSENFNMAEEKPMDEVEELRVEDGAIDIDVESAFVESTVEELTQETDSPPEATGSSEPAANDAGMATLQSEVNALKAQLEDRTSQYMRIAADFENYRRRNSKERDEQEVQIKRNTITELLPVIDNFERARAQIKPQTEAEMTIHKSYQSVYKQLVDCLKRLGVSAMRAEGQEFDPNLHEAVMREPTADHPEGTVMEELVRGYMIGDRVLRHAMVKVAAEPEPSSGAANDEAADS
ncbi:nucleotide exchange factor GrpE [Leptolyngbya iicbica LK]|uniref:Protein GrpE n=2 Tax=Cyanophyceae TaxID=3028117 RepID=A0A4Q7EB77_9CYAN|nr:nucleotide exchange factor GrpE [Leptolyngbya sp. LK]RZM79799.1 nucleotide exchange factor GrpE [Leptolyngbya sp. LK]